VINKFFNPNRTRCRRHDLKTLRLQIELERKRKVRFVFD
jgi:hypothetical protein